MSAESLIAASSILLWLLVLFHTLILLELVRRNGRAVPQRSSDNAIGKSDLLPAGSPAPAFEALDLRSRRTMPSTTWHGRAALLVFMATGCPTCEDTADDVVDFQKRAAAELVVLCQGEESGCTRFAEEHLPKLTVLSDTSGAIAALFHVKRTPTAVLVDHKWRVLKYGFPKSVTRLELPGWVGLTGDDRPSPDPGEAAGAAADAGVANATG